jgi:hypothetical protein
LSAADIAEIVTAANERVGDFDYLLAHMRYTCARNAFTKAVHAFHVECYTRFHAGYTPVARGVARGDRLAQAIHGLTMTSVGARLGFARTVEVSSIKASSIRAIVIMTNAVETNRIFGSPLNWCDTFFS